MSENKIELPSGERPSTAVNMGLVSLMSLGLTILVFAILFPLKGTFIRDLFMGRYELDPGRYIFQVLIVFVWGLSTMTVVLKRIQIRREKHVLANFPLPDDADITDTDGLREVYETMAQSPDLHKSMALNRTARVLGLWINTGDFERVSQVAREDSELDAFTSDSSFRANRLFIWAMPLLGFLGTVYGVSYGIGGFAEFLTGEVTADDIKYQVGLITQGLAVAFYTTLLGLWSAGSASFPSMGAEKKEEEILGTIDELIKDRLIARMPSAKKSEFPSEHIKAMRDAMAELTQYMVAPMQELARQIEDGFRRLPSPQRYEDIFAQAIARASTLIDEKQAEHLVRYEIRIGELGEQLSGKLEHVAEGFRAGAQQLAGELNGQADRIAKATREQLDLQASGQQQWAQSLAKASEQEASRWREISADLQRQVGDAATQLNTAVTALREASSLAARGADEAARGLEGQMRRLVDVGARIESLLQATKAVEVVLGDLASAEEFKGAMKDLRRHLETSDALVQKLSRPKQIVLTESH